MGLETWTSPGRAGARRRLKPGPAGSPILRAPGVFDALSAVLVEQAGFEAAFLSGSALAWSQLARPDVGLLSPVEIADSLARIRDRVEIPILVDADGGFGNAAQTARTVRMFEAAGADGVQIEDQAEVKPADAMATRPLVPLEVMAGKLKAAQDARRSDQTAISARTDAVSTAGFDEALRRAAAFVEIGVDLLFVESLSEPGQVETLAREFGGAVPLVHNLLDGGPSPLRTARDAEAAGFSLALFPGAAIQAAAPAMQGALAALAASGAPDATMSRAALNAAVDGPDFLEAFARYAGTAQAAPRT